MPDITAKINVNTQSGPQAVSVTLPSGQAAAVQDVAKNPLW